MSEGRDKETALRPGIITMLWAMLVDQFKLPIDQIAQLTDYQIYKVYGHKRDKDGVLKPPGDGIPGPSVPDKEKYTLEERCAEVYKLNGWPAGVPNVGQKGPGIIQDHDVPRLIADLHRVYGPGGAKAHLSAPSPAFPNPPTEPPNPKP